MEIDKNATERKIIVTPRTTKEIVLSFEVQFLNTKNFEKTSIEISWSVLNLFARKIKTI